MHHLLGTQGLAWGKLARSSVATHQVEGTLADSNPPHTVMNAPWPQTIAWREFYADVLHHNPRTS
ncbi:MAG: hypothetical protein WCI05_10000, partial [Myxococcales bacterium]